MLSAAWKGWKHRAASVGSSPFSVVPGILEGTQTCSLTEQKLCGKPESVSWEGFILHLLYLKHAPWKSHPISRRAFAKITSGTLPARGSDKFHFSSSYYISIAVLTPHLDGYPGLLLSWPTLSSGPGCVTEMFDNYESKSNLLFATLESKL